MTGMFRRFAVALSKLIGLLLIVLSAAMSHRAQHLTNRHWFAALVFIVFASMGPMFLGLLFIVEAADLERPPAQRRDGDIVAPRPFFLKIVSLLCLASFALAAYSMYDVTGRSLLFPTTAAVLGAFLVGYLVRLRHQSAREQARARRFWRNCLFYTFEAVVYVLFELVLALMTGARSGGFRFGGGRSGGGGASGKS